MPPTPSLSDSSRPSSLCHQLYPQLILCKCIYWDFCLPYYSPLFSIHFSLKKKCLTTSQTNLYLNTNSQLICKKNKNLISNTVRCYMFHMMHCPNQPAYMVKDFIADKLWVYKMRQACPTHFLACLLWKPPHQFLFTVYRDVFWLVLLRCYQPYGCRLGDF